MKLLLVRHTRLHGNEGLCYGRSDVPLAATFEDEVAAVRTSLPWRPERVWSSPSRRCLALAQTLAGWEVSVQVDERLAELHFGDWEGRRWNELQGAAVDAWMSDPFVARPPGGETAEELVGRVEMFRSELLQGMRETPCRVLIVTHAGVIRAWRSVELGLPLPEAFRWTVPFGGSYAPSP